MDLSYDQRECLFHTALVLEKKLGIASKKSDKELRALLSEHTTLENIFKKLCPNRKDPATDLDFKHIVRSISKTAFKTLTLHDPAFPSHIKTMETATPVLYVRGTISLLEEKTIAVVGTRKLDQESVDVADAGRAIVKRLVNKGYIVLSGLAEGCDTLAHTAAIEYGGKTIAVLGTSIDKTYPSSNKTLQEQIAQHHLVVTQYPIGLRGMPYWFSHRDITQAALSSEGIVVIRADDKSGTQHTIKACYEQKKPIYVLYNNVGRADSTWVKTYGELLKETKLYHCPDAPKQKGDDHETTSSVT